MPLDSFVHLFWNLQCKCNGSIIDGKDRPATPKPHCKARLCGDAADTLIQRKATKKGGSARVAFTCHFLAIIYLVLGVLKVEAEHD
jgi:hypothetical protein